MNTAINLALAVILFCLLPPWEASGQQHYKIDFNHLTLEDGLSQSSVYTILQDSEGYMWFGTTDGLNRYDGYKFEVYKNDPTDITSISSNSISVIYEDSNRNLWLGTSGGGINLYNREKDNFSHYKPDNDNVETSISNGSITAILEDSKGRFWIGTGNGLNLFDRENEEFIHFYADTNSTGLSNNNILSLYEDSKGNLWIGTYDGLNLWDPASEGFTYFQPDSNDSYSLSDNRISTIYEDNEGTLWIGTVRGGLNYYDPENGIFHSYEYDENNPLSISDNSIYSILEDSRGVLWIGTENNGLNFFDRDEEKFYRYTHDVSNHRGLSSHSIPVLYENDDQILWIGTFNGGIDFVDRKYSKFEHYRHEPNLDESLSNNSILSFLEDSRGNFLIGTDGGGLNVFDRQTKEFAKFRHDPDNPATLSSDAILALQEDQKERIWIGYYNGGVSMYDHETQKLKHYKHDPDDPNSLNSNHIFVIHEDRSGELWFGSNDQGISKFDAENEKFLHYNSWEVIRELYEDSHGNFWIGSYGGGLELLDRDNNEITTYTDTNTALTSHVIYVIHEDREGNLWIGTKEGGLHLFDPAISGGDSIISYTEKDGLPSNEIKGILEDNNGNLWISTNNGLSKFNPETENFKNYNVEDGIQSREFNPLAYYRDRDGYMYFGGINGFNRFHPDSIRESDYVPPVVLTDFQIFNDPVPIGEDSPLKKNINQAEQITLSHEASVISFSYAALDFNVNKGIQYAYKLDGFDEDWNYVDSEQKSTYTNLNPGEYVYRVKASNNDGVWAETEASVALVITPPFWQTTWFYILSTLIILGLLFSGYQLRVRSINNQNRRLEKQVEKRTTDLEHALEELKETRDELIEKAHKAGMADIATGVLHNVGNILTSVNTSATLIEDTIQKSRIDSLVEANTILRKHAGRIGEFIADNPKGEKLITYYLKLEEPLKNEQSKVLGQTRRLIEKIQLINEVIAAQQSYAGADMHADQASLLEMIENALALQAGSIEKHELTIEKKLQNVDPIVAQRTKLIHVLVNIFKNAKEAMGGIEEKIISIKTWQDNKNVYLEIFDNGAGIEKKHLNRIFTQGFTTKESGHGFGLHSSANYMAEMGGNIKVSSKGKGKGATFTLIFVKHKHAKNNDRPESEEIKATT